MYSIIAIIINALNPASGGSTASRGLLPLIGGRNKNVRCRYLEAVNNLYIYIYIYICIHNYTYIYIYIHST